MPDPGGERSLGSPCRDGRLPLPILVSIDPLLDDRRAAPGRPARRGGSRPQPRRSPDGRRRAAVVAGAVGVLAVVAVGAVLVTGDGGSGARPASPTTAAAPAAAPTPTTTTPSIDATGSLWWLVNRDRPLPPGYAPADLVIPNVPLNPDTGATQLTAATAAAFEALVADALTAGFELQLNSGYRSLEQQQLLYDRFVEDFGQEVAAERVAVPGTSEHQTGLSVDVGLVGLPDDEVFGDTEASRWVAGNAHRFGFILRYPPDKADITGYTNEPWHLRHVGVELATELHASGLTMEEHFGLVPAEPPAGDGES